MVGQHAESENVSFLERLSHEREGYSTNSAACPG
jgi:hypothetical protein